MLPPRLIVRAAPLLALLGGFPAAAADQFTQLTIRERVIIRVPMRAGPQSVPTGWKEKKAERCVRPELMAGAALSGPSSVDFILRGGQRMRARLENACPALDFYSGFYLTKGQDGMICAGRDAIHSRAGGECIIDRFRLLLPKRAQ